MDEIFLLQYRVYFHFFFFFMVAPVVLVKSHGWEGLGLIFSSYRPLQVEGHETRTPSRGRGGSRFNSKVSEGPETSTESSSVSSPRSLSRTRNGRRGSSSRNEGSSNHETSETSTFRSSRLDHDIKLAAGNVRKASPSPSPSPSSDKRRSSSRKNSSTSSPSDVTISGPSEKKRVENSETGSGRSEQKDVKQEPRRSGLFRTRNGSSRKAPAASTTESTSTSRSEDPIDRKIDLSGPSVFSGPTETPRSRTGRKIQTTLSSRDLRSGLPPSGRFSTSKQKSQKPVNQEKQPLAIPSRSTSFERRSDDVPSKKKQQIASAASESISIDVPALGSELKSEKSDLPLLKNNSLGRGRRSRVRGRSEDEQSPTPTKSTRRGSSRFTESEQAANSLDKNVESRLERPRNAEPRSRDPEKKDARSGNRGRSQTANSVIAENPERRNKVNGARASAFQEKTTESSKRGRSRSKLTSTETSTSPSATTGIPEEHIAVLATAETAMASRRVSSSLPPSSTTPRSSRIREKTESPTDTQGRSRGRASATSPTPQPRQEDFFNHGLGFRGRKVFTESPARKPASGPQNSTSSTPAPPRGNPGWTLKRRPAYFDEDSTKTSTAPETTTALPSTATAISNEIPTSNEEIESTTSSSVEASTKSKAFRGPANVSGKAPRGSKTFPKTSDGKKSQAELNESDNYPADFKARLAQLVRYLSTHFHSSTNIR